MQKEKKGSNRMSFYKTQELKHSVFSRCDLKCFETFKILHRFINGE